MKEHKDFKVKKSEGRLPELLSEFWPTVLLRGRWLVEKFDGG